MADRYWLFCSGWEVFGESAKYRIEFQDFLGRGAGSVSWPTFLTSGVRSGKGAIKWSTGGGFCDQDFTGQAIARTLDYIFWCGGFRIDSFNLVPGVGDTYIIGNCHTLKTPGAAYVAFTVKVAAISPAITVSFGYAWFDDTGAIVGSWHETTTRTLPTAWVFLVIGHYITTRETRLYINSTTYAYSQVVPNAPYNGPAIIPSNRYTAGKGSDKGMLTSFDDFGSCEGTSWSAVPAADTAVILFQPNANVSGQNNWTPWPTSGGRSAEHFRCWDEMNHDPSESATDYLYPSGTNLYELDGIADRKAGAIEGVRLVAQSWDNGGSDGPHRGYGRITSGAFVDLGLLAGGAYPQGTSPALTLKGIQLRQTPESSPADWSYTKFNGLEIGLYGSGSDSDQYRCWELAVLGVGSALTMPDANPAPPAPPAAGAGPPVGAQII